VNGLDWTGLDWTGLDWSKLNELMRLGSGSGSGVVQVVSGPGFLLVVGGGGAVVRIWVGLGRDRVLVLFDVMRRRAGETKKGLRKPRSRSFLSTYLTLTLGSDLRIHVLPLP
jgi:hypothetical protein